MDLRQLRYFVAVAEELSFSNAARRLNMSQPPLSLQIKSLEEHLGATLFARDNRNVALTEAGTVMLKHAYLTLEQLEKAQHAVKQVTEGEAGEMRIGFTASVPMFDAFPRLLQDFRQKYPGARADLIHMSTGSQLKALSEKSLDVGFLRPSPLFSPPPTIEVISLWKDRLAVTLPSYHALSKGEGPISIAKLQQENFVLFPRGLGCGLFDHISILASRAGFAPIVTQEAREGSTILGLVAAGMGVSVLPETYSKTLIPGLVYRQLADRDVNSHILVAFRKDYRPPLLKNFIELVCAARSADGDTSTVKIPH